MRHLPCDPHTLQWLSEPIQAFSGRRSKVYTAADLRQPAELRSTQTGKRWQPGSRGSSLPVQRAAADGCAPGLPVYAAASRPGGPSSSLSEAPAPNAGAAAGLAPAAGSRPVGGERERGRTMWVHSPNAQLRPTPPRPDPQRTAPATVACPVPAQHAAHQAAPRRRCHPSLGRRGRPRQQGHPSAPGLHQTGTSGSRGRRSHGEAGGKARRQLLLAGRPPARGLRLLSAAPLLSTACQHSPPSPQAHPALRLTRRPVVVAIVVVRARAARAARRREGHACAKAGAAPSAGACRAALSWL